jgi:hypothetical protein
MGVRLDGREVRVVEVKAVQSAPEVYTFVWPCRPGSTAFSVAFLNNYRKPDLPPP